MSDVHNFNICKNYSDDKLIIIIIFINASLSAEIQNLAFKNQKNKSLDKSQLQKN